MKYIDAETVHALIDYPSLVRELADAHRQDVDAMDDLLLEQPSAAGTATHFLIRAAWQRQQALGVKLVTIFPDNASDAALPSIQAVYVIFDGANGRPLAGIDGTALTYVKTAGDSALGACLLAREDIADMLMVGAGDLAPHLIAAHCAVRPSIRRVGIWNRTPARAAALAEKLNVADVEVAVVRDLEPAARQAGLICCATMSNEPLISGAWLKPGTHLDLVGGYTPSMREANDEAARRAKVYVDARATTVRHCGDISGPLAAGVITETDVLGGLFDLCRGTAEARENNAEITFYKNGGGGHLDLMVARILLERA